MGSQSFSHSTSLQDFVVPWGVTSLTVDIKGATGSGGAGGGRVQGALAVTPGETLKINVGGQGAWQGDEGGGIGNTGGSTGSVGGGASSIRRGTALSGRVAVAGGGGSNASNGSGGIGAGSGNGGNGSGTNAGGGGTTSGGGSSGGAGGSVGTLGHGGDGHGGGGGGGYYGGGGGGGNGAGGGGSAYSGGLTGVSTANGFNTGGNGSVTLSWTDPPPPNTPTLDSPADGVTLKHNEAQNFQFDATSFSGDTMTSYSLRVIIDGVTRWWRASDSSWQPSEPTNTVSVPYPVSNYVVSIPAMSLFDQEGSASWSVRTTGASGLSPYSLSRTFTLIRGTTFTKSIAGAITSAGLLRRNALRRFLGALTPGGAMLKRANLPIRGDAQKLRLAYRDRVKALGTGLLFWSFDEAITRVPLHGKQVTDFGSTGPYHGVYSRLINSALPFDYVTPDPKVEKGVGVTFGVNDRAILDPAGGLAEMTFGLWCRGLQPGTTLNPNNVFCYRLQSDSNSFPVQVEVLRDAFNNYIWRYSVTNTLGVTSSVEYNEGSGPTGWNLMHFSRGADGILRIYKNGTQVAAGAVASVTPNPNTSSIFVGCEDSGSFNGAAGDYDDFSISWPALSAAEITSLYTAVTDVFYGGAITKKAVSAIHEGVIAPAAALFKRTFKGGLAGSVSPSGGLSKALLRIVVGFIAPTGAITKKDAAVNHEGSVTPEGILTKFWAITTPFTGQMQPMGAVIRQARKILTGTTNPFGAITRFFQRGKFTVVGGVSSTAAGTQLGVSMPNPSTGNPKTGDLAIIVLSSTLAPTATPAGWTLRANDLALAGFSGRIYSKTVDGTTDPGNSTIFDFPSATAAAGVMSIYRDVVWGQIATSEAALGGDASISAERYFNGVKVGLIASGAATAVDASGTGLTQRADGGTTGARVYVGDVETDVSGAANQDLQSGTATAPAFFAVASLRGLPILHFKSNVTSSGTMTRRQAFLIIIDKMVGAITPSGLLRKHATHSYEGSVSPIGAVFLEAGFFLTGVINSVGNLFKQPNKTFTGTTDPMGLLRVIAQRYVILASAITSSGSVTKAVSTLKSGVITPFATVRKDVRMTLLGVIVTHSSLSRIRTVYLLLTGNVVTMVGAVTRFYPFRVMAAYLRNNGSRYSYIQRKPGQPKWRRR